MITAVSPMSIILRRTIVPVGFRRRRNMSHKHRWRKQKAGVLYEYWKCKCGVTKKMYIGEMGLMV